MIARPTLSLLLSAALTTLLQAQPGSLDPSFATLGYTITDQTGDAQGLAVYPDGRSVLVSASGGASAMAMFEADGSLAESFGTGGWLINLGFAPEKVVLQPDGKILVAGTYNASGTTAMAAARYDENGDPDPAFGTDGLALVTTSTFDECAGMELLDDGRIVLAGMANDNGDGLALLGMLDASGDPVTGFDTDGVLTWRPTPTTIYTKAFDVAVQDDGALVVACNLGATMANNVLVRFTEEGVLDASFNGVGHVFVDLGSNQDDILDVELDASQRIVGIASDDAAFSFHSGSLFRLNSDGSLDGTFGTAGITALNTASSVYVPNAMLLCDDGRILVSGTTGSDFAADRELFVSRYSPDGILDPLFGTDGLTLLDLPFREAGNAIAETADGRFLVAGRSQEVGEFGHILLARFWQDSGVDVPTVQGSAQQLTIAPVPVMGLFTVQYPEGFTANARLEVFDPEGRIVPLTYRWNGDGAMVDAEGLAPGTYVLRLVSADAVAAARFLKDR